MDQQQTKFEIRTYKKDAEYSYTLGAFPTFELIDAMPECVVEVLVHSTFTDREKLEEKCREVFEERKNASGDKRMKYPIKVTENNKLIAKLSDKENVYVIGVFRKFAQKLDAGKPHVVLVNPSNMGNLGTIIRTACGFGIYDMAIIEPAADAFNPKTVRASMGSLFRIRHQSFESFEEYMDTFGCKPEGMNSTNEGIGKTLESIGVAGNEKRGVFTFMLNGEKPLTVNDCPKPKLFSLVFGNEATGLPDKFLNYGTSIIIPQTEFVDSLNLTIAAGIGMYMFTH